MARRFSRSDASERVAGLREAADAVRGEELVVLRTDTVYGVGADAFGPAAIRRPCWTPRDEGGTCPRPCSSTLGSPGDLEDLVDDLPEQARQMVAVYLDAGPTLAAVPPSIVDISGDAPVLLRAGAVGADQLRPLAPGLQER